MSAGDWTAGRVVGFDLECTGLDVEHDEPVSYAFVEYLAGRRLRAHVGYAVPSRPISRAASALHGLTRPRLAALGAAPLALAAREVVARLAALSRRGVPVVGCNLSYDLTIVDRVCARLEVPTSLRNEGWRGPALDVLVLDRGLDPDLEARPVRRLEALCKHYGVVAPAHAALADADAAVAVLYAQCARFASLGRTSLEELQGRQAAWHAAFSGARGARHTAQGQARLFADAEPWPYVERWAAVSRAAPGT